MLDRPHFDRWQLWRNLLAIALLCVSLVARAADAPSPLLEKGQVVDWWFTFKFNAETFPQCGGAKPACLFDKDGEVFEGKTGQQFVFASSSEQKLAQGEVCVGDTVKDPVGATFEQVYSGPFSYVIWNDQFYDDPRAPMCKSCGAGTAHSKGMLAWNEDGDGFVLQVSTPSWPGAGNKRFPRKKSGNTLGCITKPNNILVSQHFFALRVNRDDVVKILKALQNAGAVTDPKDSQVVRNGGPKDVQKLVDKLGQNSDSTKPTKEKLSTNVILISKPPDLYVPPWQMVSALLDGADLRAATWWNNKKIFTTTTKSKITCWDKSLPEPGAVEIALSGKWENTPFELKGGGSPKFNHAKIGVSLGDEGYSIFGDMNQEGAVSTANDCETAQNKRGGLFYVVQDEQLHASVKDLIDGQTAPQRGPKKQNKRK
jgi:hypothetical protein